MTELHEAAAQAERAPNIVTIPLSKGGIKTERQINLDDLPLEVYQDWLIRGAQAYIQNNGMSKMVGGSKMEGAALEKFAAEVNAGFDKNISDALSFVAGQPSEYKFFGKSKGSSKVTGAEKQEALQLAKKIVKDTMKREKKKIGDYKPSVITELAKELLEQSPQIYATARANIEARAKVAQGISLDIGTLKADPERVQKNAATAAKRKAGKTAGPISAAQAGKVAPRARPELGTRH